MTVSAKLRWRYENHVRPHLRRSAASLIRSVAALPEISLDDVAPRVPACEPILDDICMPPFRGPQHDDFGALIRIAASLEPKLVIELGTAYGNTVANLCRCFGGVRVVTVNARPEQQSGQITSFALNADDIGRVYRRHGFASRVTQIFANTLDVDLSRYVGIGSADLAIIDACHDVRFVENDFLEVAPFIRCGGMVLLHDTHASMSEHLWGSYVACVRLRRHGYDIRHVKNTWWGVWRKR